MPPESARALIVEDDATVRVFLTRALERSSLIATTAANGAEAMEAVRSGGTFAVAFVDGLLPDIHGLALMRQLIAEPGAGGMSMCLLSGTVRRSVPVTAGVSALTKPVRIAELASHAVAMLTWHASATATTPSERRDALSALEAELAVG